VETLFALCALSTSIVGMAIDVKSTKIPNWLTLGGLVAALASRMLLAGWAGLSSGLLGALLGFGVLFLPYLARGIGGGDVKLMAAVGAWIGMRHGLGLVLATAISGGVLAIGYIAARKRIGITFGRVAKLVQFHLACGIEAYPTSIADDESIRFPYSLAIAVGALFVLLSISAPIWR